MKAKTVEAKMSEKNGSKAARASAECGDVNCPFHGTLSTRGRTFEGTVIKKFPKRIVIEFARTAYVIKYERYIKLRTRLHARLPPCMDREIKVGDYVAIKECRPLSKLIHFVVVRKIRDGDAERNKPNGDKE